MAAEQQRHAKGMAGCRGYGSKAGDVALSAIMEAALEEAAKWQLVAEAAHREDLRLGEVLADLAAEATDGSVLRRSRKKKKKKKKGERRQKGREEKGQKENARGVRSGEKRRGKQEFNA